MPLLRTGADAYAAMTAPPPGSHRPRTTGRTGHSGGVDRIVVGTLACAAAAAAVVAGGDLDGHRGRLAALVLPSWVVFGLCLAWALGAHRRLARPVLTVLLAAAVVQVPGLLAPPRTSTDAYRYVWDGRVQLAGVSPYRYAPLDDRLAPLRDPLLFPGLGPTQRARYRTTALPHDRPGLLRFSGNDSRVRINRPRVPTIYPPVAQAWFTAVAAVTPWALGTTGLQLASALLAVLVAALLARLLQHRRRDPRLALVWAWSPTVAVEASGGAHVDVLATALVVLAVGTAGAVTRRHWLPLLTGLLLGLAAAVKLTPLVLLPAFTPLGRGRAASWRALVPAATALGTLALTYLPHLLTAGALVLGYLPGYLQEEGGSNRAALLRLLLPEAAVTPAVVLLMAALAGWAVLRAAPEDPAGPAVVLFGSLLLVTTPSYPWYALPLVALVALTGRLEWLAVAASSYAAYAGVRLPGVTAAAYAVAALVVLGATVRRRHAGHGRRHQPAAARGAEAGLLPDPSGQLRW